MQSLHCAFAFIILEKCCGFCWFWGFFPPSDWKSSLPPISTAVSWEFSGLQKFLEKFCLWIALLPVRLKPGVWGSGSFRLNLVSAFQHPNKSPNSVWCCCALSMRALWATPGLLGSGNWGNHSPKSASKALIALVEANSVEDVKAHSGDKAGKEVLMQSPKNNSSPAGAVLNSSPWKNKVLVFGVPQLLGVLWKRNNQRDLQVLSGAWGEQRSSRDYSVRHRETNGTLTIFSKPFST